MSRDVVVSDEGGRWKWLQLGGRNRGEDRCVKTNTPKTTTQQRNTADLDIPLNNERTHDHLATVAMLP